MLINGQGSLVRSHEYNGGTKLLTALNSKKSSNGPTSGGGEIMKTSPLNVHEPSCEELRAMWQFSKRQSRASEITNEIPTYHDPFTYNVWEPAYFPTTTRSMGGWVTHFYHYFLSIKINVKAFKRSNVGEHRWNHFHSVLLGKEMHWDILSSLLYYQDGTMKRYRMRFFK